MATSLVVVRPFGPYAAGQKITDPTLITSLIGSPNVRQITTTATTTPTPTPVPTPNPTPTPPPSGTSTVISTSAPLMDGTASAGTSSAAAAGDHVHPHDTTMYPANNPLGFQTLQQVQGAVTSGIATVVGAAPAALDTLVEIASKLTSDESAAAVLTTQVGQHTAALASKGQANGLAPLDSSGKVPAANLPTGTGSTSTTMSPADFNTAMLAWLASLTSGTAAASGTAILNGDFLNYKK